MLTGNSWSVAPTKIEAVIPPWANVTAVANARFDPEICTKVVAPRSTMLGVTPVIIGATSTTKARALVADPLALVTVIGPVTAPAGTAVTSVVVVAEVTAAGVPTKPTAFCDGFAIKPVPKMVTVSPTLPCVGVKETIETCDEVLRVTDNRLPAAS